MEVRGVEVLFVLFAIVVAIVLPVRAWRRHRRHAPVAPTARYLLETIALTATLAWLLWMRGVPPEAIGLTPAWQARFWGEVALCLAVIVGIDVWSVWRLTRRIRQAGTPPEPEGLAADALAGRQVLATFLGVTIIGAVWEELCFRATVFLLVPETPAGLLIGVVTGSLLFGAQHLRNGRSGFLYSTFFGVLFSLLYLITGNLIAVIVAHAGGNFLTAAHWAPYIERIRQDARQRTPMFLG